MRHTWIVNTFGGEFPAPKVCTCNYNGSTYHWANRFYNEKWRKL